MNRLETLTEKHQGTKVRVYGEVKTIESFGEKGNSVDENTLLINFTDGTWAWAEETEPIQ